VILLADRVDLAFPYAFQLDIPTVGEEGRLVGLQVLWARVVSIMAAIVGTSRLRVVCDDDSTFTHIVSSFDQYPGLVEHLDQYGPLQVTRADMDVVPSAFRVLPLVQPVQVRGDCEVPPEKRAYLGIDFGRSDVKVAVVDTAGVASTFATRWWRPQGDTREYVDPQILESHEQHIAIFADAALQAMQQNPRLSDKVICGFGLSAAGCVQCGRIVGVPPAFGGADRTTAVPALSRLEDEILEVLRRQMNVTSNCVTLVVNDGDAAALCGKASLGISSAGGLFLSCGTGLAGGILKDGACCSSVLEVGKLIIGIRQNPSGTVPKHDILGIEGAAQGIAGTQRAFFNMLALRGGERIEGKAEQRAALADMQKRQPDDNVNEIFSILGFWLAQFVIEVMEYLSFDIGLVEVCGKVADAQSGTIMLERAGALLKPHGVGNLQRASDSEFGQAIAVAEEVMRS